MKQTRQSPTTTDPFRITLFFETILYFHEEVNIMKKLLLAAVLCAALVLVSAAGCIGSDPIVGTWETKPVLGIYISAEFANDGTGTITLHSDLIESGESVTFAWEKTADNTYSITSSDKTLPGGTYKLSDDGKTLSSLAGAVVLNKV